VAPPIVSPCTLVCTLDPRSGLCLGCARTIEEIALWSRYSDEERRTVMAALPVRDPKVRPTEP
jgi:predicted Fe-S protein YdhL (DUF1289 family)